MSILVTVSVNLADSVTLRDLRQFVEAAERNGADPDLDLREYDDNDDLVGLSAVGEVEADGEGVDEEDGVDEEGDEEDGVDEEGDEEDGVDEADDEEDEVDEKPPAAGESYRQS
jgi:hypothetical protein